MPRDQQTHLSSEELAALSEEMESGSEAGYKRDAQAHVQQCPLCETRLREHRSFQAGLQNLAIRVAAMRKTECPTEQTWTALAAGLTPADESRGLLEHAAECDHCGPLLRSASEEMQPGISTEEANFIHQLPSASAIWQRDMANKMAASHERANTLRETNSAEPHSDPVTADLEKQRPSAVEIHNERASSPLKRWFTPPYFGLAAASVLICALALWIAVMWLRPPSVEHLLAAAYTEHRTLEMRFPNAAYAPLRQERGPERSRLSRSRFLLNAESSIAEHLAREPEETRWIVAKGNAELLEGQYSQSIDSFRHAIELQSKGTAPIEGLAMAYFEQAQALGNADDYGRAVEFLNQALEKDPENPTILFNRAIALESLLLYNEAVRDWEHYLQVDTNSPWSLEAKTRLNHLREKLRSHSAAINSAQDVALFFQSVSCALKDGSPFIDHLPPAAEDELLLDALITNSLPLLVQQSLVSSSTSGDSFSTASPACLAELFQIRHHDSWLRDLFSHHVTLMGGDSGNKGFLSAIEMLSKASKANSQGDPEAALQLSQSALQLFLLAHSNAGAVRAQEEITHSFVRQWRAKECIVSAIKQSNEARLHSYEWIFVQGLLWQATCRAANGQLEYARALANKALESSAVAGYEGQRLQAILYSSGFLRWPQNEWQDIRAELKIYWSSAHNPIHAFDAYTELAILAEDREEFRLARDLRYEALEAIQQTRDASFEAEAHYRLGMAARMAGDFALSGTELKAGLKKFGLLPSTPANNYYLFAATIDLVALDLQQKDLDEAQKLLEGPLIASSTVADTLNSLNYNQVSGELYLRRGDLTKAEGVLLKAVSIAEGRLSTLRSESDRLDWETDATRAYRDLIEVSLRQELPVRALDEWEAFRGAPLRPMHPDPVQQRPTGDKNYSLLPPYVPNISAELPALTDETVLSYAVLSSGLAAWAFDNRGVHFVWTSLQPDQLKRQIDNFEAMCSDPDSNRDMLEREAVSLYGILVSPLEPFLDSSRLLVLEPDSMFQGLPWSALADSQGRYLIERFALSVSPGLNYYRRLKFRPQFHSNDHALIASAASIRSLDTSKLHPLPDVVYEGEAVAKYFDHPDMLSDGRVTADEIHNHFPRAVVFHFAGHANVQIGRIGLLVESANPSEQQAFEMSLFSPHDAEQLDLRSLRLVVLSACSTAQNERGLSDPNSFVRVFLRAGVPHVVATQWAVDSSTAADLVDGFYANLMTGETVSRALQTAICQLRHNASRSHPYYWAVFSAYGN